MAANDVTLRVGSTDNTGPDLDALKARLDSLSAKASTATVNVDDKEGQLTLDRINASLARVGAQVAKPNITVAGAAKAQADLSAVDLSLDKLNDKTVKPNVDSSDIEHASTMTGLLVTGAAALGPAFAVAAVGAGVFGAAALPVIEKAVAGTGPLAAGIKELKAEYADLSNSVKPEVITDFTDALDQAKGILPEFSGVAQAGGKAVGDLITDFGEFAQSAGVKSFLAFVQAQVGPDMQAGAQAVEGLANGALGLVEALNPLGKAILPVVGGLGDLVADVSKASPLLVQTVTVVVGAALAYNKLASAFAAVKESSAGAALANWVTSLKGAAAAADDAAIADKGLAVAEGEVEALNPAAWAAAAVIAVTAVAVATRNVTSANQDAVAQINKTNGAVGTNIDGYKKASKALGDLATANKSVTQTQADTEVGFARGAQAMAAATDRGNAFAAASKDDADKAKTLTDTLQTQAQQMGISVHAESQVQSGITQFGNASKTTAQQIAGLNQAWDVFTGDLLGKQEAVVTSEQNVAAFGAAVKADGATSLTAKQAFLSAAQGIQAMADSLATAHAPASEIYKDIQNQITALKSAGPPTKTEAQDLQALENASVAVANSTKGMTSAQNSAAAAMEKSLIPDLKTLGLDASTAKTDADNLANAIVNTGKQSDATKADRNALIKDLENAGLSAKQAGSFVDGFITQVAKIPKSATTKIGVSGTGVWSISENQISQTTLHAEGAARGRMVTGGLPGKDSVLIRAMPGEAVVPVDAVPIVAPLLAAFGVPGFASGGVVGNVSGPLSAVGSFADSEWSTTNQDVLNDTEASMVAAINAAITAAKQAAAAGAAAGPGGGAPAANAALAKKLYPAWGSGAEWTAWNNVAMRESGWNQYARNASSGAYGIPQALPPSKMGAAANPPESNPTAQINWMVGYIKGRYNDPVGAWAHEQSAGWYSGGGATSAGYAVVGEHGRELVRLPGGASVLPNVNAEHAIAGGSGGGVITLEISTSGQPIDEALLQILRKSIRIRGGNVQTVLSGRSS